MINTVMIILMIIMTFIMMITFDDYFDFPHHPIEHRVKVIVIVMSMIKQGFLCAGGEEGDDDDVDDDDNSDDWGIITMKTGFCLRWR